jgi:hypothetical protein
MMLHTALAFSFFSFFAGGFFEYCVGYERRQNLRQELRQAYAEADELREIIYSNGAAIRQLHSVPTQDAHTFR